MLEQKQTTVEDDIMSSSLTDPLQQAHHEFCRFLHDNAFSIMPEADGNGWQILFQGEVIGHMNYDHEFMGHPAAIWIDTCDFGGSGSCGDALKETAWAHVRICEHYSSGGNRCGCGSQPGFSRTVLGKEYDHLCTTKLEFMDPSCDVLHDIKELLLLWKRNGSDPII